MVSSDAAHPGGPGSRSGSGGPGGSEGAGGERTTSPVIMPSVSGPSAGSRHPGKPGKTFDELFVELSMKWRERTPGSGTVAALDLGLHHLGKKLVEEAAETWMAAEHESRERAAEELSQLLYWSQLVMISLGLSPDDVYSRL